MCLLTDVTDKLTTLRLNSENDHAERADSRPAKGEFGADEKEDFVHHRLNALGVRGYKAGADGLRGVR